MKRLLSIVLTILMIATMMPLSVFAEEVYEGGEYHEHVWDEWHVENSPSCVDSGNEVRVCETCGETESNILQPDPDAHYWDKIFYGAKIGYAGKTGKECWLCEKKEVEKIPAIAKPKYSKVSFTYNGKVQKPTVTIKDVKGKVLKAGTDYTLTITNLYGNKVSKPKNVGKYTITIKFKGNYAGKTTKKFTIKPVKTSIKKLTKGDKKITAKWYKKTKNVSGYQVYCCPYPTFTDDCRKVTIKKTSITSKTFKNLEAQEVYYVKVRTYKTVNGTKVYSDWSKSKKIKAGGKYNPYVHVKKGGKVYHLNWYCENIIDYMPTAKTMRMAAAKAKGYKACKICF